MSLYNSIYNILVDDPSKTNIELQKYLINYEKYYVNKVAKKVRKDLKLGESKIEKEIVTLEILEPIVYRKIKGNPTNQDLKLAVELLKIKAQDKGLQDDLDIDKYVKKALTSLGSQELKTNLESQIEFIPKVSPQINKKTKKQGIVEISSQDKDVKIIKPKDRSYGDAAWDATTTSKDFYIEEISHNDSDKELKDLMKSEIKHISAVLNDPEEFE